MVRCSYSQLANLKSKIIAKIAREIDVAFQNETLEEIMDKYGVSIHDKESIITVNRRMKILVLGELAGKVKDYQIAAKRKGIQLANIEFVDYRGAKQFNVNRLRFSNEYSDIIYGPTPHKLEGMGDTSSLLTLIQKNPNEYPKLIKAEANSKLKISISGFGDYLLKTKFYEALSLGL